jgi:hypothetical protein
MEKTMKHEHIYEFENMLRDSKIRQQRTEAETMERVQRNLADFTTSYSENYYEQPESFFQKYGLLIFFVDLVIAGVLAYFAAVNI